MSRAANAISGPPAKAAAVGALDRFGFTLFVALAVHAILVLGIGFSAPVFDPPRKVIDITLARFESEKPPEEADFIAQANQQGSGTLDEKKAPATREEAPFQSEELKQQAMQQSQPVAAEAEVLQPAPVPEPAPKVAEQPSPKVEASPAKVVTTEARSEQKQARREPRPEEAAPAPVPGASSSLLARSLEIASLQAQLDMQQEAYAKRPKIRRFTSASTLKHSEAAYFENWRRRVEDYGNRNYPSEARDNGIYGSLRLLVSILPDGSVKNIEVLHSSGYRVLDEAAERIVRLAAPFQPFPVEMRKTTDVLEIIRTWKFENQARLY
ncbi:transporter TonB [Marinobacterium nitratireducens]|uniref:Protein TonB n=1 Tax=Marinobacterium nitratireducens TaxID=518897 RepID=A0A918DQJ3_9GAMM|nr:TonB family protein [Marinobacterium nitratireducens]GGO78112.1 transporter TonB [Marinobacterium nitratireducens]